MCLEKSVFGQSPRESGASALGLAGLVAASPGGAGSSRGVFEPPQPTRIADDRVTRDNQNGVRMRYMIEEDSLSSVIAVTVGSR